MLTVIGLGNWEEKYFKTRHNIGFMILDRFLDKSSFSQKWQKNSRANCWVIKTNDFLLAKPKTLMNVSGSAVKKLIDFYKIDSENLLLVHDDLDLELGKIKVSKNQGSAGHRGVESVISVLGTDSFWRMRIGIGRPKDSQNPNQVTDFVLNEFLVEEREVLEWTIERAVRLLKNLVKIGRDEQ